MPDDNEQRNTQQSSSKSAQVEVTDRLIRRVAERVWKLWQEDMRRERERTGKQRRSS